jgi:general secretion pathway protein L
MATPSDLLAPRAGGWQARLATFWEWWSGELERLALERFAALRGARSVPLVAADRDEIVLVEPRAAVGPETRVDLVALDEPRRRAAFSALLERAGETRARVRLCLGRGEALVRRVAMPAATEENLRQVLAFEMDRLTPFRADEVYFDYHVVGRDAAAGQLSVLLALARRELVDARVAALHALGANVQGVAVRDDAGHGAEALDLLPFEQRGERETARERLVQRGLAVAVVILLALALALPLYQKRATVIALQPLGGNARQAAEATDRVERTLERQVNDYNFLLTRKLAGYPVLAIVEEVTRLLPDNTWVQQLDVKTVGKVREVQITGETTSSSKLIEILEQSQLLKNATPRGTVTRGSTPNSERFMIVAEVRTRPTPEPTPVLGAGQPVAAAPATPPAAPGRPPATAPAPPPAAPAKPPAKAAGK